MEVPKGHGLKMTFGSLRSILWRKTASPRFACCRGFILYILALGHLCLQWARENRNFSMSIGVEDTSQGVIQENTGKVIQRHEEDA